MDFQPQSVSLPTTRLVIHVPIIDPIIDPSIEAEIPQTGDQSGLVPICVPSPAITSKHAQPVSERPEPYLMDTGASERDKLASPRP